VQIDLITPPVTTEALSEVILRVRPQDCRPQRGIEPLEQQGPNLIQSLRDHLQLPPDRRAEERIPLAASVQVHPVTDDQGIGEPIAAHLRNICKGGLGLDVPCRPSGEFLLVQLWPAQQAPLMIPVRILHVDPHGDGHYQVGTRFAWELIPNQGK
jgi:hypothetical protein